MALAVAVAVVRMHCRRPCTAFLSPQFVTPSTVRRLSLLPPNTFGRARRPRPPAIAPRLQHRTAQPIRLTASTASSSPPLPSPASQSDYGAEDIQVLQGLEPVRLRPSMYIGSTSSRGLHHLVYEVVDNAVDEALAGHCTHIHVTLHANGSVTVRDNGRGIPTGLHPTTGKSALETVLTVLHAGGKFGGNGYSVSGGLHGVGVSVVNALSEWLQVQVWRDSKVHTMRFRRGVADSSISVEDDLDDVYQSGTQVTFQPDPLIFTTTVRFDRNVLAQRLDEIAYLNAGLEITLREERSSEMPKLSTASDSFSNAADQNNETEDKQTIHHEVVFKHDGGIKEYVDTLCEGYTPLLTDNQTLFFNGEKNGLGVQIALRWNKDSYTDKLIGFANNIRTVDGGTHLEGLRTSLTRTINQVARKAGKLRENANNISGEFIREGLTAIVSVKVPNPEFEGQTKSRLGNPEVRSSVDSVVSRSLVDFFEFHSAALAPIIDKAMSAIAAAEAARRAREVVRKKTVLENSTLPGKLADCASRNVERSEVFIVEGESAGGSAKQARDREFQAILPLRGKILNIEKTDDAKMYQNTEIQALIAALGLGIRGEELKRSQLRYGRVIIMTDADVDGAHIRTLLLTFFFRYQRSLVEEGFVYIACPPLYKVERGKEKHIYLYSDAELKEYRNSLPGNAKLRTQRFKGLGEMMPTQLWNTTMNPAHRQLKRVEVEDAMLADQMFTVLMGNGVAPRREFIEAHAASLSLDDIDF